MTDEMDVSDVDTDGEGTHGIARWVPAVVVIGTICSFVALAWYAYHAGTQSLSEEDLLVVEADKTPMKEKPLDPGGMKFPNQDKTIFETFSNNPVAPPKMERVLPAPEEPLPKQLDTSETSTFVKDKDTSAPGKPETVAAAVPKQDVVVSAKDESVKPKPLDNTITAYSAPVATAPAAVATAAPVAKVDAAPVPAKPVTAVAAKPAPAAAKPVAAPAPKAEAPKPAATSDASGAKIQLGAYRSEAEAQTAWSAMQKKYKELSGHDPVIVKADLGDKGIYYRLRVAGFSSAADAKAVCKGLSAKGQVCILP